MKSNKKSKNYRAFSTFLTSMPAIAAAMFIFGSGPGAHAQITFNTSSGSGWAVTGGGAVNATPYAILNVPGIAQPHTYGNVITLTSNGNSTGTFVQGGSAASFDGYWTAVYTFTLPATFSNASLAFDSLFADDRAVFELNGNIIAATSNSVGTNPGSMVFTDGGALQSYTFGGPYVGAEASGTVNSGFMSGVNTLEAIINNTDNGINGPDLDISPGDNTYFGVEGTITYNQIPEPSTFWLAGLGAAGLAGLRRWRRTRQESRS